MTGTDGEQIRQHPRMLPLNYWAAKILGAGTPRTVSQMPNIQRTVSVTPPAARESSEFMVDLIMLMYCGRLPADLLCATDALIPPEHGLSSLREPCSCCVGNRSKLGVHRPIGRIATRCLQHA